jgi:hypothetical protein
MLLSVGYLGYAREARAVGYSRLYYCTVEASRLYYWTVEASRLSYSSRKKEGEGGD